MAADFILDQDPLIPTGIPATKEQVAAMIADPEIPIDETLLPALPKEQRPTAKQISTAVEEAS